MKLRLTIDGKVYEVDVEVLEEEGQHRPQHLGPNPGQHPETGHRLASPAMTSAAVVPVAAQAPPSAPRPATSNGPADEGKVLRSPISGVVVRVPVQVGQTVQADDDLVVLEAMKMETVIASQCAGRISKIHAAAGDSVQAQQVLVEFE